MTPTAAEAIRALDEAIDPAPWRVDENLTVVRDLPNGGAEYVKFSRETTGALAALRNALPQIAAVLEAAGDAIPVLDKACGRDKGSCLERIAKDKTATALTDLLEALDGSS